MSPIITLTVTHPTLPAGRIDGFRFMWAFYVKGYRPEKHCQSGLIGRRVDDFYTGHALSGRAVQLDRMDRYPYVYICGVGDGPKRELKGKNLHFPLRYREGGRAEIVSYNGYVFVAENAERIAIPPLPDGWNGVTNIDHTRCKNFQFAVTMFGYPPQEVAAGTSEIGFLEILEIG